MVFGNNPFVLPNRKLLVGFAPKTLDAKNRCILPKEIVDALNARHVYVVPWADGCLAVLHPDQFNNLASEMLGLAHLSGWNRHAVRDFASGATVVTIDDQCRMMIPEHLRQLAGIYSEVYVVGALDHVEIWSKEQYDEYAASRRTAAKDTIAQMLEQIGARVNGACKVGHQRGGEGDDGLTSEGET